MAVIAKQPPMVVLNLGSVVPHEDGGVVLHQANADAVGRKICLVEKGFGEIGSPWCRSPSNTLEPCPYV